MTHAIEKFISQLMEEILVSHFSERRYFSTLRIPNSRQLSEHEDQIKEIMTSSLTLAEIKITMWEFDEKNITIKTTYKDAE